MAKNTEIFFENQTSRYQINSSQLKILVLEIIKILSLQKVELNIVCISDQKMVGYNQKFFHQNQTTDVISFPSKRTKTPRKRSGYLGDILISPAQARNYSKKYGNSFGDEFVTYVIHGILHLLGYEDTTEVKRKRMFRKQSNILKKLKEKKKINSRLIRLSKT